MPKAIEGIFLRPSEDESLLIWDAVREAGLTEDSSGVLKLLMLLLAEDAEDPEALPGNLGFAAAAAYFKAHPEDAALIGQAARGGISAVAQFFQKLKNPPQ